MGVIPHQLTLGRSSQVFDASGELAQPEDIEQMKAFAEALVPAVQAGREEMR